MELKKSHREALLTKLNDVNEQIELKKSINTSWLHSKEEDKPTDHTVDWHDMDLFVLANTKKLIETSLIDNEIDF